MSSDSLSTPLVSFDASCSSGDVAPVAFFSPDSSSSVFITADSAVVPTSVASHNSTRL